MFLACIMISARENNLLNNKCCQPPKYTNPNVPKSILLLLSISSRPSRTFCAIMSANTALPVLDIRETNNGCCFKIFSTICILCFSEYYLCSPFHILQRFLSCKNLKLKAFDYNHENRTGLQRQNVMCDISKLMMLCIMLDMTKDASDETAINVHETSIREQNLITASNSKGHDKKPQHNTQRNNIVHRHTTRPTKTYKTRK